MNYLFSILQSQNDVLISRIQLCINEIENLKAVNSSDTIGHIDYFAFYSCYKWMGKEDIIQMHFGKHKHSDSIIELTFVLPNYSIVEFLRTWTSVKLGHLSMK